MYHPSQMLEVIRRQLKQMQTQYENGTDEEEPIQTVYSNGCHRAELTDTSDESNSLTNVIFSTPMTTDQQDRAESHIMDIETTLDSLTQCTTGKIDEIPPSEELRYAITNITDIDDVDNLIGNLTPMEVETLYGEELHTVDHSVLEPMGYHDNTDNCFPNSGLTTENTDTSSQNGCNISMTAKEEENWIKKRQRKDNHNIIERRRRYNINDRIKDLANLLPPSVIPEQKQNKGSILTESVKHMKDLKTDRQRIEKLEENQKLMDSKHQKLLTRMFQVELKLKLYTMSENFGGNKNKNQKKRFSEINTMVEEHIRHSMVESSQEKKIKITPPDKKKNQACYGNEKPIQDVRATVRQHLSRKISAAGGRAAGERATGGRTDVNVSTSVSGRTAQTHRKVRSSTLPLLEGTIDGYQGKNVVHKTTTFPQHVTQLERANDVRIDFKEDGKQVIEISQEQCNILLELFENHQNGNGNETVPCTDFSLQPHVPAQQGCLSSVISTSNCLSPVISTSNYLSPVTTSNCLSPVTTTSNYLSPVPSTSDCLSPVTTSNYLSPVPSTSNMLERLLRRSDKSPPGGYNSSGLDESTESMTGLH